MLNNRLKNSLFGVVLKCFALLWAIFRNFFQIFVYFLLKNTFFERVGGRAAFFFIAERVLCPLILTYDPLWLRTKKELTRATFKKAEFIFKWLEHCLTPQNGYLKLHIFSVFRTSSGPEGKRLTRSISSSYSSRAPTLYIEVHETGPFTPRLSADAAIATK
jgi:hypothetical protein